ncbi:MAG: CHAT domain-containing protein [Myxococcota bacterium]
MAIGLRRTSGVLVWLLGTGCPATETPTRTPPRPPDILAIEWAGCALESESRCYVDGAEDLVIWSPVEAQLESSRGSLPETRREKHGSGVRFRFPPPKASTRLHIRAQHAGRELEVLRLPNGERLRAATQARRRGESEAALRILDEAQESWTPEEEVLAASLQLRLRTRKASLREKAEELLEAAAQAPMISSVVCSDLYAAVYHFTLAHDLEAADRALDGARACPELSPVTRMKHAYFSAILSLELTDHGSATTQLEEAQGIAERTDRRAYRRAIDDALASTLALRGRYEQANGLWRRWLTEDISCASAVLIVNMARAERRRLELAPSRGALDALIPRLDAHIEGLDGMNCAPSKLRDHLRLERAALALALGEAEEALAIVEQVEAPEEDPTYGLFFLELKAELALLEKNREGALRSFDKALAMARSVARTDWQRIAVLGQARAHLAGGALERAAEDYRQALALSELELASAPDPSSAIPVRSRAYFLSDMVEVLIRLGRIEEAANTARRTIRRTLERYRVQDLISRLEGPPRRTWLRALSDYRETVDGIEKRRMEAWRLSKAELEAQRNRDQDLGRAAQRSLWDTLLRLKPDLRWGQGLCAPPPGTIKLVVLPSSREDWIIFRTDGLGVRQLRSPPTAEGLWALLESSLSEAERLLLVVPESLADVDFRAGRRPTGTTGPGPTPLLAHSLDLPCREGPVAPIERVALAVDETAGLAWAQAESGHVRSWAREKDIPLRPVRGSEPLRAHGVAGTHFHFIGHGDQVGADELRGQIALGPDVRLRSSDIIALDWAPTTAILSGCVTAARAQPGLARAIGTAEAMVLAGTSAVVASPFDVPDRHGERFSRLFYQVWDGSPRGFETAFQEAMAAYRGPDQPLPFRLLLR